VETWKFKVYRVRSDAFTTRTSNETQRHINHHLAGLDPPDDVSPVRRHRPRFRTGRFQERQWNTHAGSVVVWNAGARRTAIGVYHHLSRVNPGHTRSSRPHEGRGACRRQGRQLQRQTLFCLDINHASRDRDLLAYPFIARTVELSLAPPSIENSLVADKANGLTVLDMVNS
jgi:hypothetical protein